MKTPRLTLLCCSLALASCSGDDDSGALNLGPEVTTYAGFTRSNGIASITRGDRAFESDFFLINQGEGGIALDYFGNAYQADRNMGSGAIQVLWRVRERSIDAGTAILRDSLDRRISGFNTTLMEPIDVALAQRAGLVIVSDAGDGLIKVWGTSAGGDVAPIFTATPAAAPHGLDYDEQEDRLVAALDDGTIAVFDDFAANRPAAPTRTITPTLDGVNPASTRLRGIAIDVGRNRVLVSDPGDPMNGEDGQLYFVSNLDIATGLTTVLVGPLDGAALSEPGDLALTPGGRIRVADEEAGELVVLVPSVLSAGPGGLTTVVTYSAFRSPREGASSVAVEPATPERVVGEVSDITDPQAILDGIAVVAKEAGMPSTLRLYGTDLMDPPLRNLELPRDGFGLAISATGDAYVSTGASLAVDVIHRYADSRGTDVGDAFTPGLDRQLQVGGIFAPFSFVEPRGLDLDSQTDLLVVADPGAAAVSVVGQTAPDDAESFILLTDGYDAAVAVPRAVDYDRATDRLFVGNSNGTIYVYDTFLGSTGTAPDRILTPGASNGTQASVDIAALEYDAERNLLLALDVGAATGMAADGSVYLFEGASTASGLVEPDLVLAAAQTGLDDPSDMAWNGSSLWVVDPTVGVLVRFDDVPSLDMSTAPDATLALEGASAVALVPAGLNPATGGSIATSIQVR